MSTKPYGVNELREMFLSFFESKGHLRLPSFSLIPQNDASLLLINSGMAPMKPYFTGEVEPPRHRVCTCQKCIRTGDIENIGKTARHGTYFEMLGNFSFGDYFKREAIHWSWEFLTEVVGLDKDRLYPSIYVDDDEAFDIWNKEVGVPADRIFRFGKEDNFWEHGSGPCGPCSEIYYDRGEKYGCGKPGCTVGCDCDRYMEVWNNVFSQFNNDGQGNYTELAHKNIDTGMGLERLAVVCQDVDSLFDVDTVMNITNKVTEITGASYGQSGKMDVSLRVITDHIRASTFMIADGVLPSNEGRGYVLRRLLRRAARHGKLLGVNHPFLHEVVETVIHENESHYTYLRERAAYITKVVKVEEENFARTIDGGMKIFADMLAEHKAKGETVFSGADAFKLYDTYGFPVDLTADVCRERNIKVDEACFEAAMEEQRRRAREASGFGADYNAMIRVDSASEFKGYDHLELNGKVTALFVDGKAVDAINAGQEAVVVLDQTPFYAESGGQVGDKGERIPLTIAGADTEKGTITLVIQAVGGSSRKICELNEGDYITDVVGPLGQATHIEKVGTVVCAGGGVGVAPLLPIVEAFHKAGNRVIVVLAARTKDLVILEEQMRQNSDEVIIMTDDGSYGMKGLVTNGVESVINRERVDLCVTIGPAIMMKFVSALTKKYEIPTVASLNTIMVDGTGMCGACRITVGGKTKFVCVDGPEFDAHQVDFDEMIMRLGAYKDIEKK